MWSVNTLIIWSGLYNASDAFFLKRNALSRVIVTDRDQALMNAVKAVFPDCTNFLSSFHINKNVKAKITNWAKKCLGLCHGLLGMFD